MNLRTFRKIVSAALALLAVGLGAWLGYQIAERQAIQNLRVDVNHRLELFASAVEGMIQRLEHVPATVQLSEEVQRLLRSPTDLSLIHI